MTWRLADSVPGKPGPLWLTDSRIADLVALAILVGERERHFYELYGWAVMPNHVHLLIFPLVQVPVLMRWLKGSTVRHANQALGRTGERFWQDKSFDHYLRGSNEIGKYVEYIEGNPVSAGLVSRAQDWRWSSAGWQNWQAKPPAPPGFQLCKALIVMVDFPVFVDAQSFDYGLAVAADVYCYVVFVAVAADVVE
jgi:REP element-mobilizing transposase RayT